MRLYIHISIYMQELRFNKINGIYCFIKGIIFLIF